MSWFGDTGRAAAAGYHQGMASLEDFSGILETVRVTPG
jgi:hypothetical protein